MATALVLPAASVASTENVYVPSPAAVRSTSSGLEHGAQSTIVEPPRSTRQLKPAPASPVNDQATVASGPGDAGAFVMTGAAGATRSRTYVHVVGAPMLPASSTDRAAKVYVPSGSPLRS